MCLLLSSSSVRTELWHSNRRSANATRLSFMSRFTEVADRVWVAHYDWMHVNITLVGGDAGLLMVDTHGSERMARTVADDVRRLGAGPLSGIINTHEHTPESGERAKEQCRGQPDAPHAEEGLGVRVVRLLAELLLGASSRTTR